MSPHLSTLALHKLRYGELSDSERAHAAEHLQQCALCSERLAVQERDRTAFSMRQVPPALRRGAPVSRPLLRSIWFPLGLLAAAAIALLLVRPVDTVPSGTPQTQFKGELPAIEVWVDLGQGPRLLRPGEALQAGDRVQLKVDATDAPFIALAGRDGRGLVEVYGSFPGGTDGLQSAPFGLVLDDAPGPQELFVLTSERPLDDAAVKAAVRRDVPGVTRVRTALAKRVRD